MACSCTFNTHCRGCGDARDVSASNSAALSLLEEYANMEMQMNCIHIIHVMEYS